MSKTDKFQFDLEKLIFNGVPITNVGASAGTTSWWVSLHTADPTNAASTANEGGYAAYTRVQTDRSTAASGWVVTSGTSAAASASPVSAINFPQVATTSTGTFSFMALWPSSGAQASSAIYVGTVSPGINFSQNVTPQLTTASSITED
jgi:hypothetical protein